MFSSLLSVLILLFIGSMASAAAAAEQPSGDLMKSITPLKTISEDFEVPADIIDGFYRFSHALLASASVRTEENIMVSPLSAYLALAMTTNGADHETKTQMISGLSDGTSIDDMNATATWWLDSLTDVDKHTVVEIANSIWVHQDYRVATAFLQTNADYYHATAHNLDFNSSQAAKTINNWVSNATKQKIVSIIDRTSADMLMILINASYFKSMWEEPFEERRTRERTFHTPSEDITRLFMHTSRYMNFLELEQAEGIILPYEGNRFSFFAILPEEGIDVRTWFATQQPKELFTSIIQNTKTSMVDLGLPTFVATFEKSLVPDLMAMGIQDAFIPAKADFSLMSADKTKDLFISDVKHKTFVQVDEQGTEAAAVTAVVMKATSMAPGTIKKLVFDRPFFYGIVDHTTGLPLFIGMLDNPTTPSP